jgi:two-component system, OmpR family, response regulator CpxR
MGVTHSCLGVENSVMSAHRNSPSVEVDSAARRILIIDDDVELCELLTEYLVPEGFQVDAVHSGTQALERAFTSNYSLLVLDVMLPGTRGFEVLQQIRTKSRVPVIMLTARGDEVDRILGLEIGADDYLPKPFNPRELAARIQAVLRRASPASSEPSSSSEPLRLRDIELDPGARSVKRDSREIELTSVEFDLLNIFLRAAGTVLQREELARQVLGRDLAPFDRSIDVHVSNLRRKLGPLPDGADRIKAIRSVGYLYVLSEKSKTK